MIDAGESVNVTSGVRDKRDVQSIRPERIVEILFCCLIVSYVRAWKIRGQSDLQVFRYINKEFLCIMFYRSPSPGNS